jgi:peptide/nickel transport system substrate-binding protein
MKRLALVAGALAALAASGCGSSNTSGNNQTAIKAADINPQPRDKVKDGGTLRISVDQFSTQWNYNQVNGPEASTAVVVGGVMPDISTSDAKGDVFPDPNYVKSWKVTAKKPRQVVTYELNPKARWSDGKPITWKDFEAQWKALRSANGPYQIASSTGYDRMASVARGRNDYEVVVTYARPFGEWQSMFAPLYPAEYNSDPKKFNSGYLSKIPVTAGPFKLGSIDQTAKTVTMVRDPKWWGARPKLDRIITRALEVDAAINAYANGEVDVADVGPSPSNYKRAARRPDGAIREAAGPDFRHITINGTSPFLSDVNVRKAIAMGINRDAIARADLTGLNWPARTMGNHFLVNTQVGYRDNSDGVGHFDPAKARQLLDQAGWKTSGTFRRKNGKTLELRFVIPTGIQESRNEGELVQAMLRDIGVKVDIRPVPSDDFFDKYIIPGNYDLVPFSWIGTPFPISSAVSIYAKPVKDAKGQLQIQQNFARVGSKQIDDLMARALAELNPTKARDLINQADKLVWDEVHSVILYQRPGIIAVTAKLANYGSFGFQTPDYTAMGFMK